MNREILFRAKRKDDNAWIYGNYLYVEKLNQHFICPKETEIYLDLIFTKELDFIEIIPETVTQYIGFTEKKGNKIFEGDIVTDEDKNYIVSYHRGSFILNEINKAYYQNFINCYMDYIEGLKIIGNRFDNPELLD